MYFPYINGNLEVVPDYIHLTCTKYIVEQVDDLSWIKKKSI